MSLREGDTDSEECENKSQSYKTTLNFFPLLPHISANSLTDNFQKYIDLCFLIDILLNILTGTDPNMYEWCLTESKQDVFPIHIFVPFTSDNFLFLLKNYRNPKHLEMIRITFVQMSGNILSAFPLISAHTTPPTLT